MTVDWAEEIDSPEPTSRLVNQLARLVYFKALFLEAEPVMRRALSINESS